VAETYANLGCISQGDRARRLPKGKLRVAALITDKVERKGQNSGAFLTWWSCGLTLFLNQG
jgi:hypothetical protein